MLKDCAKGVLSSVTVLLFPFAAFASEVIFGVFTSVQVNVTAAGENIEGDRANEPTIAVNPRDANNLVIGWRRFDPPGSGGVRGGYGYSRDGGLHWQTGVLPTRAGLNRTDPVLAVDADGRFYYQSLGAGIASETSVFQSADGGQTWSGPVYQFSGDKNWLAVDRSGGIGHGNVYATWRADSNPDPAYVPKYFVRSTDGGLSYRQPEQRLPVDIGFGRIAVGPGGQVYISGKSEAASDVEVHFATLYDGIYVLTSDNARDAAESPVFTATRVDLGGYAATLFGTSSPNPGGAIGDVQIGVDASQGSFSGHVYLLANVVPEDLASGDRMDLRFARSEDGGSTWSESIRVNDDPARSGSFQWFPMMDVAPNSRIDAVWYDTRNGSGTRPQRESQLYYSYSWDGGVTWSQNQPVSPVFDTHKPYLASSGTNQLQKDKLGDYTQMVSDRHGAHVAYAATFNGEQDVYYLRVFPDCDGNGQSDVRDIETRRSGDINANHLPDRCEALRVPGDLDGDRDVDRADITLLLNRRNAPTNGPNDPADLDANGLINGLDARKQVLLCTRPGCAV